MNIRNLHFFSFWKTLAIQNLFNHETVDKCLELFEFGWCWCVSGVIKCNDADTARLLASSNIDQDKLFDYAREAADFATNYQVWPLTKLHYVCFFVVKTSKRILADE